MNTYRVRYIVGQGGIETRHVRVSVTGDRRRTQSEIRRLLADAHGVAVRDIRVLSDGVVPAVNKPDAPAPSQPTPEPSATEPPPASESETDPDPDESDPADLESDDPASDESQQPPPPASESD